MITPSRMLPSPPQLPRTQRMGCALRPSGVLLAAFQESPTKISHSVQFLNTGIVIEQDYENRSPTGTPTTGVPINDLTLSSIVDTVDSSATNIYHLCGSGSCSSWTG